MKKFDQLYNLLMQQLNVAQKRQSKRNKPAVLENETELNNECADAGLTTNAVFGSGNTSTDSLMNDVQKTETSPGVSVADVKEIYTPSLNGVIPPVYRRKRKK